MSQPGDEAHEIQWRPGHRREAASKLLRRTQRTSFGVEHGEVTSLTVEQKVPCFWYREQ
jgi:hypothetical protein